VKYYCNLKCEYIVKGNEIKAVFSASLLQSSVSHDPSEITLWWFNAQETFLIMINVENSCAASCFCWNHDSMMNRKFKRTAFIWNRNLLKRNVTFDQLNASSWRIDFFLKICLTPNFVTAA